jgi:hypothetical protein
MADLSVDERYREIGENYRYFLAWRERLFAGYLAVLAALALAFVSAGQLPQAGAATLPMRVVMPLIAILISWIFWMLEFRNRDLFHCCQNAGRLVEKGAGIYSDLAVSGDDVVSLLGVKVRHSDSLDVFVSIVVASCAWLAAYEIIPLPPDGPWMDWRRIAPFIVASVMLAIVLLIVNGRIKAVEAISKRAKENSKERWENSLKLPV